MGLGNRMRANLRGNSFLNILQLVYIAGMAGVAQLVELWIVIPMPPSNISDLTPKPVRTFADKRVFADKLRTKE